MCSTPPLPPLGGAPLRLGSLIASERDAPAETLLGLRLYVAGDSDIQLSRSSRGERVFLAPLYMNIALRMEKFEKKLHFFKNIFVGYTGAVFFAIIQLNMLANLQAGK